MFDVLSPNSAHVNNTFETPQKIVSFVCDDESDLVSLPTFPKIRMGSTAHIINTSDDYILGSEGWVLKKNNSGGSGEIGGGGITNSLIAKGTLNPNEIYRIPKDTYLQNETIFLLMCTGFTENYRNPPNSRAVVMVLSPWNMPYSPTNSDMRNISLDALYLQNQTTTAVPACFFGFNGNYDGDPNMLDPNGNYLDIVLKNDMSKQYASNTPIEFAIYRLVG